MKRFTALLAMVILLFSSACAESAAAALQELYAQGELLMVQGDYAGAAAKFEALGAYSDASQMAMYCKAIAAAETHGLYSMAVDAFVDLGDFKDSKQMARYYRGRGYEATSIVDVASLSDEAINEALSSCEEAEKVYGGLTFFKDSQTRKTACSQRKEALKTEKERRWQAQLKKAAIGSYVIFGTYEQDNNLANGNEDIEWLVLAKENNRLLVISRYALDSKHYHDQHVAVTWETCTLRTWLNQDFLNTAFSSAEQAMIPTVTVKAEKQDYRGPNPGNDTQDRVFLLSSPEVELYFPMRYVEEQGRVRNRRAVDHEATRSSRTCKPTAYLAAQLALDDEERVGWWLRSPGDLTTKAEQIENDGVLNECTVDMGDDIAVRPAMWIELTP